ncbi:hypothetical protein C475_21464 [Halosimplex carlsbadense 2-9-1]|uniref:Uncharacterized protein n=1 Tax=Halosimplex carlsbadense 2-9-1 TaxID=797114 RepID=M0CDG1_9EURY|nr:hypothetical protein [Halosimplex carlsbadense]ELZ19909.1 hypothetical protein C475_21464 [Halosimplex carlsbadense 2-9-1]
MTDSESADGDSDATSGARMTLGPDAILETEDGNALDCPACGTTVTVMQVIEDGHCPNYLDEDDVEVDENAGQVQGPECTAELSLELLWED